MSIHFVLSRWGVWITASLAMLAFLTTVPVRSEDLPAPREVQPTFQSADLRCVSPDAAWMVSLKVADLWKSKPGVLMRRVPGLGDMLHNLSNPIGLTPLEIRRATVLQYHKDIACVLWLNKPVQKTHLVQSVAPHARQRQLNGRPYYINEEHWIGLVVVDDQTVLLGKANEVEALFCEAFSADGTGSTGPLHPGLCAVAEGHDVVVAINPPQLALGKKTHRQNRDAPPLAFDLGNPRYRPLFQASGVTLVADFKPRETTVDTVLTFPTERIGRLAEQAIHPLRKEIQDVLLGYRTQDVEEGANPLGLAVERFARACTAGLHAMKVEREGTRVRTRLSVQCSETVLGSVFLLFNCNLGACYATTTAQGQSERIAKLGLAMLEHHRKTGRLPARAVTGPDGKSLLSWRVALLPYLGEKELYKQFRLNEPWDSEHNRKLIARMPDVFRTLDGDDTTPTTTFQVFWGKETVFSSRRGKRLSDLKDGPEQTILVVDAGRRVPWTKPEDVHVVADESLPRFCQRPLRVVLADGRVLQLPGFNRGTPLNETHLWALITPNGADKPEAQNALMHAVVFNPQGTGPQSSVLPAVYQPDSPPPTYVPPPAMPPQFVPTGVPVPPPQTLPPSMTFPAPTYGPVPPLPYLGPPAPPALPREVLPMPTPVPAPASNGSSWGSTWVVPFSLPGSTRLAPKDDQPR